jgi:hypothetical protein
VPGGGRREWNVRGMLGLREGFGGEDLDVLCRVIA